MKQIIGIQYLRAIAALLVVITHTATFFPINGGHFQIGRFGVDLFFVISGFVMWITAGSMTPTQFMLRRVIRIVPIYWMVTIMMSVYTFSGGLKIGLVTPLADFLKSLFFIPFPNAGVNGYVMPVVEVGWTLNLEMLFYVLFALALLFRPFLRIPLVLMSLAGIVIASSMAGPNQSAIGFYGTSIVFEFVAGMALGWLYLRGWIRPSVLVLPICLVIVVPVMIIWVEPSGIRAIDLGIAATVIVYATVAFEPWFRGAPSRVGLLLGNASYSIYLIHKTPLELFVALRYKELFPSEWMLAWPLALTTCILLGLAVYLLLERPMTIALLARFSSRHQPAGSIATSNPTAGR